MAVLRNCFKLKDSGILISEDFRQPSEKHVESCGSHLKTNVGKAIRLPWFSTSSELMMICMCGTMQIADNKRVPLNQQQSTASGTTTQQDWHENTPVPLVILSFNARSIVNKTEKLKELLLLYSPDVVIITETWLHSSIHDSEIDSEIIPPSYALLHSDRDCHGGGVKVYRSSKTVE